MNARRSIQRFVGLLIMAGLLAGCATSPPAPLPPPTARLPAPVSAEARQYLGLPAAATSFALTDIKAEILIVHVFDMYCHVCQDSAANVNGLYELIQQRGDGERIKLVGLGAGDTAFEVETYRKKFKVPFPLVPDRSKAVSRQFGPVRTPTLNAVKHEAGTLTPFFRHLGYIGAPESMLKRILKARDKSTKTIAQPHEAPDARQPEEIE